MSAWGGTWLDAEVKSVLVLRKTIGWSVAQAYRLAGARRRAVARAKAEGAILPIVFHAARADEVRQILCWLKDAECLEHCGLSFDDGWLEFKEILPVLNEFKKSATLFIAPGETVRGNVWTDEINVEKRQALYGVKADERYAKLGSPRQRKLLNEQEVREIAKHPLVKIGNHTWSHLSCTHRPMAEVLDEVDRAQAILTEWCGYAPTEFAYPFGRGTSELDVEIRKRGLRPHYTRQGLVTEATLGAARNMVYEGMSLAENLGRILMAWPKVGSTR